MNECPMCGNFNDFMDSNCVICNFCFVCGEDPCSCSDWDESEIDDQQFEDDRA